MKNRKPTQQIPNRIIVMLIFEGLQGYIWRVGGELYLKTPKPTKISEFYLCI